MKVKVGNTVKVIAGKDKGREGKVIKTLKKEDRVVIAGVNMIKKHQKPSNTNETGGIIEREAPIHVSNVKVLDSAEKKAKKAAPKKESAAKTTTKKTTTKKEKSE